jgi:hypothetical protein
MPGHAQPQGSDVFSSSGQYDRFAVGGAHRWYDNHSTEVKQKSGHCLSILDEAKAFQDKALALYEEAKRPGNSRQQSALVKQANEQIRLRGEKLRAFTDCVNEAIRQKGPLSDQFASGGDGPPSGDKNVYRVPEEGPRLPPAPGPNIGVLGKAIDDCLRASVDAGYGLYATPRLQQYSGTAAYSRGTVFYDPSALSRMTPAARVYTLATAYARHATALRDRYVANGEKGPYDAFPAAHGDADGAVGFLTRCVMQKGILPMPKNMSPDDSRITYDTFLGTNVDGGAERLKSFDRGFTWWPLSPLYVRKNRDRWPSPQR